MSVCAAVFQARRY